MAFPPDQDEDGGEHTATIRVQEGHDSRAYSQSGAFDVCKRNMAGVVRRWPVEDGEGPA